MVSSARQHDMLAYADQGDLLQLLSLISEDIPVIVLQNLGTTRYPLWHYALVFGYDLQAESVIVHTGRTERRIVPMDLFESTWRKGSYWLLAVLPPEKSSKYFNAFLYIKSAQDLMEVGKQDAAIRALESATYQWPDYWLSYFLLGNHYLSDRPALALSWYKEGLDSGTKNPSYLNNYAYALIENDCNLQALDVIQEAISLEPDNPRLQDSLRDIRQSQSNMQHAQNQICSI
jgi:hypothetical protein